MDGKMMPYTGETVMVPVQRPRPNGIVMETPPGFRITQTTYETQLYRYTRDCIDLYVFIGIR